MTDWQKRPLSPNCVTIFGAGVAGLTAAHELVERGFRVQIWEKVGDPRYPHQGPDIGGMARTQWSRVNWNPDSNLDQPPPLPEPPDPPSAAQAKHLAELIPDARELVAREAKPLVPLAQKLVFVRNEGDGDWHVEQFKTSPEESAGQPRMPSQPAPEAGREPANDAESLSALLEDPNNYFIIRLRDYEAGGGKEQDAIVDRVIRGLKKVLPQTRVVLKPESPEIMVGNATLLIRPDANLYFSVNTYARLEYYIGKDYTLGPTYFGLTREWKSGHVYTLGEDGEQDRVKVLRQFADRLRKNPHIDYVYVESCDRDSKWLDAAEKEKRATEVHLGLQEQLDVVDFQFDASAFPTYTLTDRLSTTEPKRKVTFEIVVLNEFPSDVPPEAHLYTGFRVRERWLPGEHGYRLFPNCYRHLFDTMKRTPILDTIAKPAFTINQERAAGVSQPAALRYIETGRTVFDNIRPTTSHLLAFEHGAGPSVLSRSKLKSIDELRELMHIIFAPVEAGGFEVNGADSVRLSLKMLQYIISSPARRQQYEAMSWWDFVDGDSYGERLGKFLEVWPEALVAMDAKSADARSHGDSLIQVTLDQFRDSGFRDGTLRGPVSEVWFRHWRRYLEAQGVEFLHGELTGFEVKDITFQKKDAKVTERKVLPKVACFEPRYPLDPDTGAPQLMPGYFVLAVSADQAASLSRNYAAATAGDPHLQAPPGMSDIGQTALFDDSQLERARPESDFRHFAGLQFYFAEDSFWATGHVYYPESPWGLSSVSQARFWEEKTDWEHGFRGVLSVIVATWDKPGELTNKCAWECSPVELATEVWHQIKRGVERRTAKRRPRLPSERYAAERFGLDEELIDGRLPEPLHWRLDENLEWCEATKHYINHAPFHIARPGKFQERPGDLNRGYTVENGFVMCGMHMQTQFRLPTMEAANESARHAVNAILKQAHGGEEPAVRRTLCETWDPEMFEFDSMLVDLQSLKDLDHLLVERGLPHAMEILDADKLARKLTREVGRLDIKGFVRMLLDLTQNVSQEVRNGR